jgi:hypothetical protein
VSLYCYNSRCRNVKQVGDRCEYDQECGHLSFCWFGGIWSEGLGTRALYGECRNYMGLSVGERAFWSISRGISKPIYLILNVLSNFRVPRIPTSNVLDLLRR